MEQKKEFIINSCTRLQYPDKMFVLNIIKNHIDTPCITEGADGCRINLDKLPDELIIRLFNIVENKLNETYI